MVKPNKFPGDREEVSATPEEHHMLLLSKDSLNYDEIHAFLEFVSQNWYTIKLTEEQYNRFWRAWNKIHDETSDMEL